MSDLIHIRKSERYEHYRILNTGENSCIEQPGLSWAARGLHTYLMTRGGHWKIHKSELLNRATDGRRNLEKIIQELKQAGYLAIKQERNSQGRFQTVWEVRDEGSPSNERVTRSRKAANSEKTIFQPHTHLRGAVHGSAADGTTVHEHLPINDIPIDDLPKREEALPKLSKSSSAYSQIRSQFESWIRDYAQPSYVRLVGEKTAIPKDSAVLDRIHDLIEEAGFSWEELARRYECYLSLKEDSLRKRGYPFEWFLDRFNSLAQPAISEYHPKTFEIVR